MVDDELTRELLELEHRGWASLSDGSGAEFYGSLMTDDGVMVLANGAVADREAVVGSLRDSPPWQRFEIEGARAIRAGADGGARVRGPGLAPRVRGALRRRDDEHLRPDRRRLAARRLHA